MNPRKFILPVAALMMAGCASDRFDNPEPEHDVMPTLSITIGLEGASRAADGTDAGTFQSGEGLENYIDIPNDNYRIYFFTADKTGEQDKDNTYIATFKPMTRPLFSSTESNGSAINYTYSLLGEAPAGLPLKFKIVVLANWPKYPEVAAEVTTGEYQLVKEKTTISDICNHAYAQFDKITSLDDGTWLSIEHKQLMPFYGVRSYDLTDYVDPSDIKDGKIHGNIRIDLSKNNATKPTPLPLLRAMAKVEVILDNPVADFDTVIIDKVNYKGFCAPDALQHSDYFHDYDWDKDFIHKLHLPDRKDDYDYISIPMRRTKGTDGKYTKRWIAYVPEYRNISDEQNNISEYDVTFISVKLKKPEGFSQDGEQEWEMAQKERNIYFSTNGSEAANKNGAQAEKDKPGRYNIERNNIYRFTITGMTASMDCRVDVQPYASVSLSYDLGLMRDERGDLMVLPDKELYPNNEGNLPDFFLDYMKDKEWPKDKDGNKLKTEKNDYYAIVLGNDGDIKNAEIWLKDAQGCKILTNYAEKDDNSENCSTREVTDYSGLTSITYHKDKYNDRRLQHNHDHSSVVIDPEGRMIFKQGDNTNRLLVESWDEESKTFWYEKSRKEIKKITEEQIRKELGKEPTTEDKRLIGQDVIVLTYQKADHTGKNCSGIDSVSKFIEKDTTQPSE